MGYPKGRVFEQLNVSDPEQAILERYYEDMLNNEVQMKIQMRQAETMMALQGGMQQEQPGTQHPGFQNAEGPGFNPNQGGVSPAEMEPGATREMLAGVDRQGLPMTEV